MSIKWWMENSSRKSRMRKGLIGMVVMFMVLSSGCSLLPDEQLEEQLPTITPPPISQKPEHTVTTGLIEVKVRGIGKIMSMQEEDLFFTSNSARIRDIYVQTGQQVAAGQLLAELDTTSLENQIRQKRLSMRSEELAMIEILRQADEIPPDQLEQAKIDFELKRLELVELEEELQQAKLVAPFNGTIVAVMNKKGDQVQAYDTIMVISDLSQLVVAAEISDSDKAKIAAGMDAVVDINAHGQFTGKVSRLPIEKEKNNNNNPWDPWGGNNQDEDSIDDYMLVEIDGFPENAQRGTPLSVQVIMDRRDNVVVIPPSALRTLSGRYYVQVVEEDGTKREVDVEVGQQTPTQVEIIKGLEPGQKVVGR